MSPALRAAVEQLVRWAEQADRRQPDGNPGLDLHVEDLRPLVEAYRAVGPADDWQAIETAPCDGTIIDLWVNGVSPKDPPFRIANCKWDSGWVRFTAATGQWTPIEHQATHWRLVAPPADAYRAVEGQ